MALITVPPVQAGGMTLISTTTLSGSSVALTSIPQSYKDLKLIIRNFKADDGTAIGVRFNGDSTSNRHVHILATNSTGTPGYSFNNTLAYVYLETDNGTAYGLINVDIFDYTNTSTWKYFNASGVAAEETTPTNVSSIIGNGCYNQTNAITSLTLLPGSGTLSGTVLLYGVS